MTPLCAMCNRLLSPTPSTSEIYCHMEDLDNHGRRCNLRVRGVPESIDPSQLSQMITTIFNDLIERPPDTPIAFERIHRALRPRGRDTDPPRDTVCCLMDFPLKEEIFHTARNCNQLSFQGSVIKIYQDLSNITLQRRRELLPILDILRARSIIYCWKFPFGLSASHQGRTATLRVPEYLEHFCSILNIPLVDLPDWYSDFRLSLLKRATSMEGIAEAGIFSIGRRRPRPLPPHFPLRDPVAPRNGSPTASPAHRRACIT